MTLEKNDFYFKLKLAWQEYQKGGFKISAKEDFLMQLKDW